MKKTYIAPMMEKELFETSDVITVSIIFKNDYDIAGQQDSGIPVVDAAGLTYKDSTEN